MKIEFTHDIIAKKVWERLPEEERQLRLVATSLRQRLEDYKKGNGSLLGLKELVAWEDYFPLLTQDEKLKKFVENSRLEVQAQQEKERLINQRLRSRLNIIYVIAGALLLLAIFFFFQARTIRFQKNQIEADAQKATQLRKAFGADDQNYFIEEGINKFKTGDFQEAIYDFALAQFLSPPSDTILASSWIQRSQKGLKAKQLFQAGQWEAARQLIAEISVEKVRPSSLIQQLEEAENIWQDVIEERPLNAIKQLDLSDKQLHALPEELGQLVNLERLYLEKNHLITLPQTIGKLKKLTDLVVNENDLDSLPSSIGQLAALDFLDLSHNELSKLPASFGQLRLLNQLNIEHNQLDSLPPSIGNLTNLAELNVSHNSLTGIPREFIQLRSLKSLSLGRNEIDSLPEAFGQFPALTELDLDSNQMVVLPKAFHQMQALEILHLSYNQLEKLPENFGQLKALRELYLNHNQLKSPPSSFGQLENLSSAYFQNNQINQLSAEFFDELPQPLTFIDMTSNPLSDSSKNTIRSMNSAGTGILIKY